MHFTLDLSHHLWTRDRDGEAPRRTIEMARAADSGGIHAIWASEDPEGWDAFAVLSAIAAVTDTAVLGTSVTSPYPRHPNLLAASIATLDRLSSGRAVLGIGRGQTEWHRNALGVDTGDPLEVLGETLSLLRQWWKVPRRASTPEQGHFKVRNWERVVHPKRDPVPIYLAAAGKKALTLAGSACDGVIFNSLTSDEFLHHAIPHVRAAAVAAGRDPDELAFVLRTTVRVTENPAAERKALDREKNVLALVSTLPGMGRLVRTKGFDVSALLNALRTTMQTTETLSTGGGFPDLRRNGDLKAARAMIPDDLIRQLGIIGSLSSVKERLIALTNLGITHIGVAPPENALSDEAWRCLLRDLRH